MEIPYGTEFRTFWADVGDYSNLGIWTPSWRALVLTKTCAQPCAHICAPMNLRLSVHVICTLCLGENPYVHM